jgi:hypothetical protein
MNMELWWNDTERGEEKRSARIKPRSNATLSTTNPTQNGVDLNQDFQAGNVAFNLLRQGMAPKEKDRLNVDERILKK